MINTATGNKTQNVGQLVSWSVSPFFLNPPTHPRTNILTIRESWMI
jgi:hypothetical protein